MYDTYVLDMCFGASKVDDVNGCHTLPASRGGEVGMGGEGGAVFCVGAMCDVDGEKCPRLNVWCRKSLGVVLRVLLMVAMRCNEWACPSPG